MGARMPDDSPRALTPRENEVAALVAQGMSNAAIAERLGVSESTIKVHLKKIFRKSGCRNRAQLAVKQIKTQMDR